MNREAQTLDAETPRTDAAQPDAPSVGFIQAISQFLDTDPADLLVELGYYTRDAAPSA